MADKPTAIVDLENIFGELEGLGWAADATKTTISQSFKFKNFVEAFAWMTQAALLAEKLGHHPDWSNSYNRVEVSLTTHSAGGLTALDVQLAKALSKI